MKGWVSLLCAGLLLPGGSSAQQRRPAPLSAVPDPVKAGEELAARLRAAVPAQDAEFTGKLVIVTEGGRVSEMPVASKVTAGSTNWQVIYQTFNQAGAPHESLRIVHTQDLSNTYFFTPDAQKISPKRVSGSELTQPLGGSDFWLMDLGLDFLQWPGQKLLRNEMRRSRPCYVLESTQPNPAAGQYSRVLSWIDTEIIDGVGLIRAEAFDSARQLMKEFNVGKFRKIDGQWQLQNMKITSEKTGQETELRFDPQKR